LVCIAKGWAKGFRIEHKDVEERKKYICICLCTHKKKRERERKERKRKERKRKVKNPRQCKKDIMRDDKSSEGQEKCKEGCDDVENESSMFHTMCNPTSRTSLVP
jgi:hypothetical protein